MKIVASALMISALFANTVAAAGMHPTSDAFRHYALAHHCGPATSSVTWHGTSRATQSFRRCGPIRVTYSVDRSTKPTATTTATARPTVTTITPTATAAKEATSTPQHTATPVPRPIATQTAPTATAAPSPRPTQSPTAPAPIPTSTVAAPTPTATALVPSADPAQFLLFLLNSHRLAAGMPPLTLNLAQSNGTSTCVGSIGHSQAMQQSGAIWHGAPALYPQYDYASFPKDICLTGWTVIGENVGSGGGSELTALQNLDALMMNEPHDLATCSTQINHACNIINPAFHQVGIGLVYVNNIVWVTEDFTS